MKSVCVGAGLCAALSFSVPAAAQTYEVWGIGNKRCGAWTDMALTNKEKTEAFQSWAHGFLTGAAYGRQGLALKHGADTRPQALVEAVDDYCRKNPLMTVERAAVDTLNRIAEEKAK